MLLAVAGLAVVQRLVSLPTRQAHNDATGTIFAALYVLFGVTMGFSLLLVWQQYDASQRLAVAALTVLVSLILYTVSVLEYPFNDSAQVRPDAFELVLIEIHEDDSQ